MKMYPPAGDRRVRARPMTEEELQDKSRTRWDGAAFVIEVNVSIDGGEEWRMVAYETCLMDAQCVRSLIVRTIQAEVGARLGKRR
jgi:hypothetical protein